MFQEWCNWHLHAFDILFDRINQKLENLFFNLKTNFLIKKSQVSTVPTLKKKIVISTIRTIITVSSKDYI